jgi:uncharacterized Zn-binding protein involved in type VI secretion
MPQKARLNDPSSHGGHITSASTDTKANGIGIARNGDSHTCPITGHGVTALVSTSHVKVNGRSVIRVGDRAGCGAIITVGSPTVSAT